MSGPDSGRTLEALPFVSVRGLADIEAQITNEGAAVIHRNATMDRPYSLEVVAFKQVYRDVPRLCLDGTFMLSRAIDSAEARGLQARYIDDLKLLNLGDFGIRSSYENGNKKSLKLGFEDDKTTVTTWFTPGERPPFLFKVSNNKRDGQNSMVSSMPARFESETLESRIVEYMKLLSIIDKVLGSPQNEYRVGFVEAASIPGKGNRSRSRGQHKSQQEKEAKQGNQKLETELASLDEKYRSTVPNPEADLDKVHGLSPDALKKIEEKILAIEHPDMARLWGVSSNGGILLYGEPGTGKTMLATAISTRLKARLWQIRGSDIIEKWIGNSAKNVTSLIESAKKYSKYKPIVILMDEIDALITNGKEQNTERDSVLGEFKQGLEDLAKNAPRVLVIGTTNHPEKVDKALRRPGRFDQAVYMELPDEKARTAILLDHISMDSIQDQRVFEETEKIDFSKLAHLTRGMTGADIASIIQNCRLSKFREHVANGTYPGAISQEDIETQIYIFSGQSREF